MQDCDVCQDPKWAQSRHHFQHQIFFWRVASLLWLYMAWDEAFPFKHPRLIVIWEADPFSEFERGKNHDRHSILGYPCNLGRASWEELREQSNRVPSYLLVVLVKYLLLFFMAAAHTLSGMGPRTCCIMAKCSRFSCVWNSALPAQTPSQPIRTLYPNFCTPSGDFSASAC